MTDEAVETVRTALTRGRHSVEPYPEVVAFDSLVQRLREAEERAEKAEGLAEMWGQILKDSPAKDARIQTLEAQLADAEAALMHGLAEDEA